VQIIADHGNSMASSHNRSCEIYFQRLIKRQRAVPGNPEVQLGEMAPSFSSGLLQRQDRIPTDYNSSSVFHDDERASTTLRHTEAERRQLIAPIIHLTFKGCLEVLDGHVSEVRARHFLYLGSSWAVGEAA
jgi:hypothetical protein